jgi:hypothetical protein
MCIICIELDKNKLTPWEARRNLTELIEKVGQDHAIEVDRKISEAIIEEINLSYGATLYGDELFCHFCGDAHCDCDLGG